MNPLGLFMGNTKSLSAKSVYISSEPILKNGFKGVGEGLKNLNKYHFLYILS